jgi:hypothetical protein
MLDPNIKVVHTRATDGPQSLLNETDRHIGPVEIRTTYVNYLHKPVVVVERNNLKHIVPSVDCVGRRHFIVRKEIMIHHPTVQEIRRVLSVYNNDENASLTVIRNSILGVHANQSYRGVKIIIDYPISMEVFRENEGTVYCQITDKVLSVLQYDNVPEHPYAVDTINRLVLEKITGDLDPNSPTVKIELVDNEHRVTKRFISLLGKVREIKSKIDNTRRSGVYVNTVERDGFREEGFTITQTFYELDKVEDQLGIYRTKEESEAAGDLKTFRKENVVLLEHENILLSKLAEKEKLENKIWEDSLRLKDLEKQLKLKEEELNRKIAFDGIKEELEKAALNRKLEHEKFMLLKKKEEAEMEERLSKQREEYEKRNLERKDKYEEKSTFLKSVPDALKFLLAIATLIGTIFVTYKKFSSAS